jgi:hypothetical protein
MTLGEYPLVNLAKPANFLFAARKMFAAGTDPMAERRAEAETKQNPDIRGMFRSEMRISGTCSRIDASAANPSEAVRTV